MTPSSRDCERKDIGRASVVVEESGNGVHRGAGAKQVVQEENAPGFYDSTVDVVNTREQLPPLVVLINVFELRHFPGSPDSGRGELNIQLLGKRLSYCKNRLEAPRSRSWNREENINGRTPGPDVESRDLHDLTHSRRVVLVLQTVQKLTRGRPLGVEPGVSVLVIAQKRAPNCMKVERVPFAPSSWYPHRFEGNHEFAPFEPPRRSMKTTNGA